LTKLVTLTLDQNYAECGLNVIDFFVAGRRLWVWWRRRRRGSRDLSSSRRKWPSEEWVSLCPGIDFFVFYPHIREM